MTINEKIKCFRTLKNMTQKALGEATGIGEATIRKYELGIRNPKPAQIKKIAQALDVGENIFFDIPLATLDITTAGEAASLLLLLENKLGASYSFSRLKNGDIDTKTLSIHFENETVNNLLARWISDCQISENGKSFITRHNNNISDSDKAALEIHSQVILEETKQSITSNQTLLSDSIDK